MSRNQFSILVTPGDDKDGTGADKTQQTVGSLLIKKGLNLKNTVEHRIFKKYFEKMVFEDDKDAAETGLSQWHKDIKQQE